LRLEGLALVLHAKFNAVGWPFMDAEIMPLVGAAARARLPTAAPAHNVQLTLTVW
jgi:hypothetical protein